MKKMFIAIMAVFTLLTLFIQPATAQAAKKKQATVVSGVLQGSYVENILPFGKIIKDRVFGKDSITPIYFTVLEDNQLVGFPGRASGVIYIFDDQKLRDTIQSSTDSGKVVMIKGAIIDPLTDWHSKLKKQWAKYLEEDGFESFKTYEVAIVTSYEVMDKETASLTDLGANVKFIKAGTSPTGETNGKWVFQAFGGWVWVQNK